MQNHSCVAIFITFVYYYQINITLNNVRFQACTKVELWDLVVCIVVNGNKFQSRTVTLTLVQQCPSYHGDLDNYRPISILCVISKIVERPIIESLFNFLISHDLILPYQSGFMKNHSCSTGLTAMLNTWLSDIDQGHIIEILNIDLRKAFNLVNHEILLTKLSLYGAT